MTSKIFAATNFFAKSAKPKRAIPCFSLWKKLFKLRIALRASLVFLQKNFPINFVSLQFFLQKNCEILWISQFKKSFYAERGGFEPPVRF